MPDIILPDRRRLRYDIYGDRTGFPIIYCHGFPSSRIEASLFDEIAIKAGVRLIAPDRPGFGESDFQDERTISDWPRDIRSLVDHLLSTFVFIAFLVEFLLVRGAAHSVFFTLMTMAFIDVLAGFSVSFRAAGRDFNLDQ